MSLEKYLSIFRYKYRKSENNIDEVIVELKKSGATQAICTMVFVRELSLSLSDADKIIVNSSAWIDTKEATDRFRDSFGDFLENAIKE